MRTRRIIGSATFIGALWGASALANQAAGPGNPGTQPPAEAPGKAEQQQPQQQKQQGQQQQGQHQPDQQQAPEQKQQGQESAQAPSTPPGMSLAQATELSRTALVHITSAATALENKDSKKAQSALDQAAASLRQLYTAVPAGPVLSDLGSNEPGQPLDLAPLVSAVRTRSVWMDPEIVAGVEEAQRQAEKGNQKAAQEKLSLARQRLEADVALLPIEDAYARVQAARGELRDGRPEDAARLLRNVPVTISHVQVSAPLVPVRFNLRAAATAAEEGNWDEAKQLVSQAAQTLQQLASAPPNEEFQKEIKPIVDRAEKLNNRLEKGQKPRPKEMRDLAKQTRALATTL